jgi:hypothetical protein
VEGREPLQPLQPGILPRVAKDANIDKLRESQRLHEHRAKLNLKRDTAGLPRLSGKYTKEEIDHFTNLCHYGNAREPLRQGILPQNTGDAKIDKLRESGRIRYHRAKLNLKRDTAVLLHLSGRHTKEEIDHFPNLRHY